MLVIAIKSKAAQMFFTKKQKKEYLARLFTQSNMECTTAVQFTMIFKKTLKKIRL